MDHPWEDYDEAPTWWIILQGWTITIPTSLSPNPWSPGAYTNWTVVMDMLNVPLIGSFVPATITVLYYFDHSVASQCAQQKEILICWRIGNPPANGVNPHSPMHTKNLVGLGMKIDICILITANY
ncbi:putative bicarbonate transporter [Helianthus annuus]|nr:putative bicarbonate transporter [Helianthus annuus]KAJ0613972.1 putative bicarbonate transporter [Helianthus annuus]KAJ0617714.1 putative bicarbonate transporter [Helianthus annuus]KAJ0776253.1 putative bicarbonate transporter [Helianthus annuus]KAJ0938674.1 putative bicarbonate transporter [Helianthus annuus]